MYFKLLASLGFIHVILDIYYSYQSTYSFCVTPGKTKGTELESEQTHDRIIK